MPEATNDQLREAYDAIKANRLPEARRVLDGYLKENPNDADGWWLLTYATTDTHEAREALNNVLRLDPVYPGARELSDELGRIGGRAAESMPSSVRRLDPVPSPAQPEKPAVSPMSRPKIDDNFDFDEGLDNADEEETEEGFNRRRLIFAVSGFLLVVLLVVLVFVLLPRLTTAPEPTQVADQPTIDATNNLVFEATEESSTLDAPTDTADLTATLDVGMVATESAAETPAISATETLTTDTVVTDTGEQPAGDYSALYDTLAPFDVVPDSIRVEQTSEGATLAASVCVSGAAALRDGIPNVMAALAGSSDSIPADGSIQTIGARFTNCTDNTLLRYVGVSVSDAQAFAGGTLSEQAFRAVFRVVTP